MKKLLSSVLLLTSLTASATIDSFINVEYARIDMHGESTACMAKTLAWDGISHGADIALNLAATAITNPQKVYAIQAGGDQVDINYLTQFESDYEVSAMMDYDTQILTVDLKMNEVGADQANILYYLLVKNAFNYGATKVKVNVKGVDALKSQLYFPTTTNWPVTKTSPVYKNLKKQLKKNNVLSDC